ncbi:cytidine deaminase [Gymnopus androsaceus JB14]|uniref:Cytidine deaminase n=1 Tax=Gymnopus androsaceus JB14 TaxID=1447944 RepID=A0A6A4I2G5_9AGAR|nr:cytidine deaminase [Gymnopus androsaceus JB14]
MAALSEETREALIKAAFEARELAYNRYSNFRVGAALLTSEGTIFKGANIENASYGGTICAERTAIVKSASEGKRSFAGLAIVSDVISPISPCGLCRQVIREFCTQDMPIFLVPADYPQADAAKGGVKETSIGELLPDSFGPEQLELPRMPIARL